MVANALSAENVVGPEGAIAIAEALKKNNKLRILNLSGECLGEDIMDLQCLSWCLSDGMVFVHCTYLLQKTRSGRQAVQR